ncbi:DUF4214 domain-containing protein [Undibacterium flavidum]|uniref:DUF4214 domain-containing protein n=1 Tax=Undibacterium flavidum TaxID=2762297 RepID=A0ABR6Y8B0_9BURK|nr:DUF4214 domain-containing protein [Undibacterium flavidum]MBC3872838.1 DUF4214 domain-containing protein [Undibacterium flavidum]
MASVGYQNELIKMYLAAFIRPPEKSGLEYWLLQLNGGKTFDSVLETVFSLDIVKEIYPTNLPFESFVTLIYVNVFGKSPDLEGLNYWKQQMIDGRSRGNLVMDMINAGLSTVDGTPGKAYIVNRLAVSQFAVDQQFTQKADLSPAYLKTVMQGVNANPDTIAIANKALGSGATGIGLGAPVNALIVTAAADGISAAEAAAGVDVVVNLLGTNAVANNVVELLIDGSSFPTAITKQLSAADITAKKVSLLIPKTMNWGADGIKLLQAIVKDSSGNTSAPGGDLRVDLNIVAPKAPSYPLSVTAALDSINLLEKSAGVTVSVDITDTNAVVGDRIEILLNDVSFSNKVLATLTEADLERGTVELVIPGTANWGVDGDKVLAARVIDVAGNIGGIGGAVNVKLDTIAPNPPGNAIKIPVATAGISLPERANPISVVVDLTGTNAKAGDAVELFIDDKVFGSSTLHVLSAEEVLANTVTLSISAFDTAWSLADGNRSISVRMSDKTGNVSKSGGNLTVLLDSLAPKSETTSFTIDAAKDGISSAEKTAGVAVVVSLLGSGAVAGDTVSILSGTQTPVLLASQVLTAAQISAKQAIVTIPASSAWGADGSKVIAVSFTDIAGNTSIASPALNVILDTTAPLASTKDLLVPASLNGINTVEKADGVVVKFNLSGTQAQAKDKVEILLNGAAFSSPITYVLNADDIANELVSLTIPGNAAWGADGIKQLSARVTDLAGNVGALGASLPVVIDTIALAAPSTPLVVPANADGGISIVEKNAGVEVKLSLAGTNAQIGDRAELLIGGQGFATPVTRILTNADLLAQSVSLNVGPNDGWGADGAKVLTVRLIDFAGNVGLPGGSKTVTLDGVAPNPTAAVLTVTAAQNGINLQEKTSGFDVVVDLNGTGTFSGDTLNLFIDGQAFSTPIKQTITAAQALAKSAIIKVPANADWLADGSHVLTVVINDAAGNVSSAGGALIVQVDTTAPKAATNPVVMPAAINGISSIEKNAGVAVELNLAGTNATVADKVELLINGIGFSTPIVQTLSSSDIANGLVNLLIPANANWGADGSKNISFRVSDVAGNVGAIGGTLSVTLDTTAPAGPSGSLNVPANSGGGISQAELNAGVDVIVSLVGAAVTAGDSVEILIGNSPFTTPVRHVITTEELATKSLILTIAGSNSWGGDGTKNLTARFIDIAGNIGTATGLSSVTVDTTGVNPITGILKVSAAQNGISAAEKNAGVDVVVDLTGTGAVSGDQIQIFIDGVAFATPNIFTITAAQASAKTATVKIPGNANWISDGNHLLSASLFDKAGNASIAGGDLIVSLDTLAPNSPSAALNIPAALNGVNNAEKNAGVTVVVSLSGAGVVAGDSVELLIGGKSFSPSVSQIVSSTDIVNGQMNVTIGAAAGWGTDGLKAISARFVDAAGNVGLAGGNANVVLDTVAPAGPSSSLTVPANDGGGISLAELNAGVDVIVSLVGAAVIAGDSVEILIGNSPFSTPIRHVITTAELAAKSVSLTIAGTNSWGADGTKNLTARFIDIAGNTGTATGLVSVSLDTTGINPIINILKVSVAQNGINATEKNAGVDVVVDLAGTGAVSGDQIQILIDGVAFATPNIFTITAAQASAKTATVRIPGNADWISDGNHLLSASLVDKAGNTSIAAGDLIVSLDTIAPGSPSAALSIPAALNGLNAAEKNAGVTVVVSLSGAGLVAGDSVELLIDGKLFSPNVSQVLTNTDILNGQVSLTIGAAAGWGIDGVKALAARFIDVAGNVGVGAGKVPVNLDTVAPAGPTNALVVPVNSAGGITTAELNAGVDVIINLTGVKAVEGETVEILIAGNAFTVPAKHVLTAADILAKTATVTIGPNDGWGGDGSKGLTARFIDSAGNVGTASGLTTVTLDALPPNPVPTPLVVAAAANAISNAERLAGVNVVVDLTGTTSIVGDTITLLIDGVSFSTPVTQKITAAQITAKSAIVTIPGTAVWGADGNKILSATIADAGGNTSLPGGDVSVLLDTTAPVPATNPLVIAAALNGISAAEKTAGVAVTVDLTGGGAGVGDRVEIVLGGAAFPTPVIKTLTALELAAGSVVLTIPTAAGWGADGTKSIAARFIDGAGNIGVAGVASSVNLDTTAPAGPVTTLNVAVNSGGGITLSEKNAGVNVIVNLNGTTVVAGDLVEVLIGGLPFANPVNFILTPAEILAKSVTLTIGSADGWGADGAKILTARFIDIAGNVGSNTGTLTVTLDTGAPNPPSTPLVVATAANGISATEKSAGVSVLASLSATGAVAGDTIQLLLDGAPFATPVTHVITNAEVGANAATIIIPGVAAWGADGSKVLTAMITDTLGNVGAPGGSVTVLLDTVGPTIPSNPVVIGVATNGISLAEKSAGVSVNLDLTGTGVVFGDSIELLLNHLPFSTPVTKVLSALEVGSGLLTMTIPGSVNWGVDGSKIISFRGIDNAGNNGSDGGSLTVTLDTVGPTAPTNPVSVAANSGGGITAAEKNAGVVVDVNLTGTTLVAGELVELLIGGVAWATPIIHSLSGTEIAANLVSLTIGANDGWGADGAKSIGVRFIDSAGNIGAGGASTNVLMLDTTPPNVPNLAMTVAAAINGINLNEKNAGVSVFVNLSGTNAAAGDIASLLIDGSSFSVPVMHTITAGEVTAGNFTFNIGSNDGWGADGSKVLSMIMTDVAGNTGLAGGNVTVVLDATLPNAPSSAVGVAAAAFGINLAEKTSGVVAVVNLSGTNAVVGDRLEILLGGAAFSSPVFRVLNNADILAGSASLTITGTAGWGADGVKNLSARIQDSAGNIGLAGGSLLTNLDTTMPASSALPVYTDVDGSSSINVGDTFLFVINEATNTAITINEVLLSNAHILGTGATAVWSPDGTQLTVTLGTGTTVALGDIVTLVGVSDLAGNSLDLAFSL